jgi:hypothetical protein
LPASGASFVGGGGARDHVGPKTSADPVGSEASRLAILTADSCFQASGRFRSVRAKLGAGRNRPLAILKPATCAIQPFGET